MTIERIARVAGILFILFVSVFALDVFGEGYSAGELAVALFKHLLPSAFPLLAALIVAWRWPLWGSAAYFCVAVFFTVFFATYRVPTSFLLISVPALVLSLLFYLAAQKTRRQPAV